MSIKMVSIIFFYLILFSLVLEFLLRIFYSIFHKIYKQKGFLKSILFPYKFNYSLYENFGKIKNKKFNDFRFDSQIALMNLNENEFIENFAKANDSTPEFIKNLYSGYNAFEKLTYEPFVGFNNHKNMNLSYCKTNENGFQDTIKINKNDKKIKKVFIVGGSVAFGFGVSDIEKNITNSLDRYLNTNEKNNSVLWEVLNFSFMSCQSTSEMNLLNKYIKLYKPDYVIQLSGFNDLFFYLHNNFKLYTFNKSDSISEYLYSSMIKKIFYKFSFNILLFKVLYFLIYRKISFKDKNNIYTIY